MKKKIAWKWLGKNVFIPGCPARDLVDGEAEARDIVSVVEESVLYERVQKGAAKKKEIKDGA